MKAAAAAAAFRKLLAAATRPRARAFAEETETLRSPADESNGTSEEEAFSRLRAKTNEESSSNRAFDERFVTGDETLLRDGGGYAALRGVFEAARFRSRSEDETMAALDDPSLEPEVKAHVFEREFERVRQFEKKKEWTECVAVGEARRTDAQDAAAAERRRARPRRGTRRRPRRWPGWPGAIPADGARYGARRGGDNGGGGRRSGSAPFDVQPPVRGRLAQAPRGAGPLRASRAPGHRAKPRRDKASRRASASPRVGFCARIRD